MVTVIQGNRREVLVRLPGPITPSDPLGWRNLDPSDADFPYTGPDVVVQVIVIEENVGGDPDVIRFTHFVDRARLEEYTATYDRQLDSIWTWTDKGQLSRIQRNVAKAYIQSLVASSDSMVSELATTLLNSVDPASDHPQNLLDLISNFDNNSSTSGGINGVRERVNGLAAILSIILFAVIDREVVEID